MTGDRMDDGRPDETVSARTPADTGDRVARLAADYHNMTLRQLSEMVESDPAKLLADIRSMAASLRRQNERP